MMAGFRLPIFVNILVAYLVIASAYLVLTPDWQAPDEPAHYNYVRYLATYTGLPELVSGCYDQAYLAALTSRRFPPDLPVDYLCYEFHQPPLYYLLAAPIFLVSSGSLLALRCLSVVLGAGVVILAFFIGQAILPNRPAIALGTMAFVAFVPMHLAILASVNNDALAELILAALLLLLTRRLLAIDQPSIRNDILLGGLLGLGLLTKMTIYIAIPLVALALWGEEAESEERGGKEAERGGEEAESGEREAERGERGGEEAESGKREAGSGKRGGEEVKSGEGEETRRREGGKTDWPGFLKRVAPVYALALTIAMPWYIRNAALYGHFDIFGLARHDEVVVGQLRTADRLAEVGVSAYLGDFVTTTFHSFWGQFGWMAVPMDGRTYLFLTLLTLIAGGGLVGFWILDFGFWIGASELETRPESSPELHPESDEGRSRKKSRRVGDWRFWQDVSLPHAASPHRFCSTGQRQALLLMGATIILMVLVYGWYNLTFVQFQGRYLFPALIPLGLFFSLGLSEAFAPRRAWWLVGGLAVALAWVVVASTLQGNLDKWVVLIVGLALGATVGRALLPRHWPASPPWLMAACYGGLGLLALLSPFWFVLPYLSPE